MVVKKHQLVADNRHQLDLAALSQYFKMMNEESSQLPPLQDLIKHCQDIVRCLARTPGTADQLWQLLEPVEHFLLRSVTTVPNDMRYEVFKAILDKIYSYISDPQSDACTATAAVLIIIDDSDENEALSSARMLIEQTENGPTGPGLGAALSCLYHWLHDWHGTPGLGFWILAYIKSLEDSVHHDVLIEASQDNLVRLLSCFIMQQHVHQNTANVIFHVLSSLRESVEAFDRISTVVGDVLVHLASESGQWSRHLLQDLVDIVNAMVEGITRDLKGDAHEMFRDKYADVILCLERHMASRASKFLQLPAWRTRNSSSNGNNVLIRKVGLLNLGNTCYMNSVIQALLVTRQFSSHVVLQNLTLPYWEKLGELFVHMMYSVSNKLDPEKYFRFLRPPFFTLDTQHDSSEFLGYLLELFQSYEHSTERNHDYSRPPVLNGANRLRSLYPLPPPSTSTSANDDMAQPGQSRRPISPRPGSSRGSGSSGSKRSASEPLALPPRKRFRVHEATVLRRDSAIDGMFGGVLLTRVQCTVCHSSSLSRDVFRDLQLAFPEKPEGRDYSVQSLLEFYCSKESLTGDNKYQCHKCGGLRDAERSVLIETTPKYLILVLKNFKYITRPNMAPEFDSKLQVQTKLMHTVYYNHTITLPTVRGHAAHASYNVFAAVIHAGTTLDSGHYYTLAKDNDQWHKYNDCSVTYADESHLNKLNRSSTPYILFYRRTDIEEPPAPTFEQLPRALRDEISSDNKLYVETVRTLRLGRP